MRSLEFLRQMIDEAIARGVFPSAALAVGRGDELLFRHVAGRLSLPDGEAANVETRYDLASLTKLLAPTMIALRAIEDGLLTLDDNLGMFFDAPEDKRDITVRMLMTHTSGVTPHFLLSEEAESPADAIPAILRHPLEGTPGDMPRYSCMGYMLLGRILEIVHGKPLDALAQERVFAPLGMEKTGYKPEGGNIAATEIDPATGRAWVGVVHDENARFLGGVSANAGLFSDIGDCAHFASMLACGGFPLLSPTTLAMARRNRTPGFDNNRGLGLHLGGATGNYLGDLFPAGAFGHTGFTGTSLAVDPETRVYVVLLGNRVHPTRENAAHLRFRRVLHNRVYAAVNAI